MAQTTELLALLRLKNELSPAMATVVKDVNALEPAVKSASADVMELSDSLKKTSTSAAGMADGIGRTATTMARSADAFGLPANALRTLDDVMDIAELGFNNLSSSAAGFNVTSIAVVGAGLAVGSAIGTWIASFPQVRAVVDNLRDSVQRLFTGIDPKDKIANATAGLKEWQAQIKAVHESVQKGIIDKAGGMEAYVSKVLSAAEKTRMLRDASELAGMQITNIDQARSILKVRDDTAQAEANMKKFAEETRRAGEALFASFEREALRTSMAQEEAMLKEMEADLVAAEKAMADLQKTTEDARVDAWAKDAAQATKDAALAAEELATSYALAAEEAKDLGKEVKVSFGDTMRGALKDLPSVILGAIQGGGDVGKAIGSKIAGDLGQALGEKLKAGGSAIGGAIGGFLGPLGGMLGSLVGGLVGKGIGKIADALNIGGNKVIMQVNDMRDAFFEAHGGWEKFAQSMAAAGQEGWAKRIFDAKTVEEFNALVREAEGILGAQTESQEALNDAVQRYGFTIDELGPKWKQQEMDKLAADLLKDYKLLVASGIDVNTVIARMGPNLVDFVNTSRAAGTAIPEAMRPVIEQLIASGQLLDENGEAFTSVEDAGLSFTETLTEGLSRAIDAINRLVAALGGIPQETPPVHVPVVYDDPGRPGVAYHDPGDVPQYASGINHVPRDGMAYLHRGERVVPASQNKGADDGIRAELSLLRRELPQEMARAFKHAMQTS